MDAHIEALNRRDNDALTATLHFPHYRLSGTTMKVWPTADSYLADFLDRAGDEWSHSSFCDIVALQNSPEKVHLDAEIRRYRHDDSLLTSFRSLWVITCVDGKWAAQIRSSFAYK